MSQRADAWVSLVVGAVLTVGGLFFLVGEVATDRDLTQRGTRGPAVVVTIEHHRSAPDDAVVEIVATGTRADLVLDQWGPDPRASERVDVLYDRATPRTRSWPTPPRSDTPKGSCSSSPVAVSSRRLWGGERWVGCVPAAHR